MGNEDVVVSKNKCTKTNEIDGVKILVKKTKRLKIDKKDATKDSKEKILDFVQLLPLELVEEIFLYLEPRDLASCTSVSTAWREAVNSNKVWGYHCQKKGWKEDFDQFSHFYKAHKQFRKWTHSTDSFSPICQKRLLFNKQSCLQKNWKCGKHIVHKLSPGKLNSYSFRLFEPMACDGKYLVMMQNSSKFRSSVSLNVWSLDGVPSRVCSLPLETSPLLIEAIAFDHETIAVIANWIITVYTLELTKKDTKFEVAYKINDLVRLAPDKKSVKDKKPKSYLKVTEDSIIYVPSLSHSSENYLPVFFWERSSGKLLNELKFDSMYYDITNAIWYHDSCYLSLNNKKTKSHQIIEFSSKTKDWESFSQNVTVEIEQILVSNLYILGVTKATNSAYQMYSSRDSSDKEIWLWERTTGTALTSYTVRGKNFQFVGEYLIFHDASRVSVMDPKTPSLANEFEVSGTISSAKPCTHSNLMVIIKTECYIEVWDWELGTRLYTITAETGYGNQIWCDDKRIITYNSTDSEIGIMDFSIGIMILGFW